MTYFINKTNMLKSIIEIGENTINTEQDITLFGRKKLNYGEKMNENLLHLMENFACPEDAGNPGNPDLDQTSELASGTPLLTTPVKGQKWYNTTNDTLYIYKGPDSGKWLPLAKLGETAANWGVIAHGQQIPKPVSSNGYVFDYDECSWMVSPFTSAGVIDFMECTSDDSAFVTMNYSYDDSPSVITGLATYMIIGIRDNINLGDNTKPVTTSIPDPTPTPTPTNASLTPTPTLSLTPTQTPTQTITPTQTASQGAAVSQTPTPTPTQTLTPTQTPTQTLTPATTVTPTPTNIAPTPTASPVYAPILIETRSDITGGLIAGTNGNCNIYNYGHPIGPNLRDDNGVNCSTGAPQSCVINECAPETGGVGLGPVMEITISGGLAPYTVELIIDNGQENLPSGECFKLGVSTVINSSTPSGTVIKMYTGITDGETLPNLSPFGSCSGTVMFVSGDFEIKVTDDNGTIYSELRGWSMGRYNEVIIN